MKNTLPCKSSSKIINSSCGSGNNWYQIWNNRGGLGKTWENCLGLVRETSLQAIMAWYLKLPWYTERRAHPHPLPVYQYQNDVLGFYKGLTNPTAAGEVNVSKAHGKTSITKYIKSSSSGLWGKKERKWTPEQLSGFYAFFQNMVHLQLPKVPPLNWRNWDVSQFSSFHLPGQHFPNTDIRKLSFFFPFPFPPALSGKPSWKEGKN